LLSPWGDWPDWLAGSDLVPEAERSDYLKADFLKKVEPLDPVRWLPQLKVEHLRIQNITDDGVTPKVAQERIESVAPATAKVQRYASARQFYGANSGGRLFEWLKEQMHPMPEAAHADAASSSAGR
jgi:hypothetical protein